jgi:membrane associated rhomboid family serine protease
VLGKVDVDDPNLLILRDRLIVELVEPTSPSAQSLPLVSVTDREAEVLLPGGESLFLLTLPAGAEIGRRAREIYDSRPGAAVHILSFGADPQERKALRKSAPFFQLRRKIHLAQLDERLDLQRVYRSPSTFVKKAVERLRDAPVMLAAASRLTRDETDGLLARSRMVVEREVEFHKGMSASFPFATAGIAAVCVVLHVLASLWGKEDFSAALYRLGAQSQERVAAGEWWRLFSAAFLHVNFVHLLVNMLALASFGAFLERLLGRDRFLVLYTVSAAAGSAASAALRSQGLAVGASGAIWGLMGAGAGLALRPMGLLPPIVLARFKRQAVTPVAVNFLYSFRPGIDKFAHFGGGIAGFLLLVTGLLTRGFRPTWKGSPVDAPESLTFSRPPLLRIASLLCVALMLGSIATAISRGRPWELDRRTLDVTRVLGDSGLSLSLPRLLGTEEVEPGGPGNRPVYRFGALGADLVSVDASVWPPEVMQGVGEEETLKGFLSSIGGDAGRLRPTEPATVVTVGSRRMVVGGFRYEGGAFIRLYFQIVEGHPLLVRVYSFERFTGQRLELADAVAASARRS